MAKVKQTLATLLLLFHAVDAAINPPTIRPVMANLSSSTFGKDDYTKLLSELSVADDWKNVIGQNLYRNTIIRNREFANFFNGVTFPDVPTNYDYQVSYTGSNKYTSYNLTARVEFLLCIDKELASKCSYTTRMNVDMQRDTAKRLYSVVKYNNGKHSLATWYDKHYNTSDTVTPDSNMLLTPTGLIDTIHKKANLISDKAIGFNSSGIQDCKTYSNLTYAASVADNNIYPIGPQCFIDYMKSYANPTSNFNFPSVACNNVSYAVYEDPGFIAGGPLVLEVYNVWKDLSVAIAGYNTPISLSQAITNIDYLPNSVLNEYYLLYKAINETYDRTNITNYNDAEILLRNTVNQAIVNLYKANRVDPGLGFTMNFTIANTRNVFAHASTNAAVYMAASPVVGEVTKISDLLGSKLGSVVPQYVKTRKYCLYQEKISFNSTALMLPLTSYATDVNTGKLDSDVGKQWSTSFAILLTSWVVAAATPSVLFKEGRRQRFLSVIFLLLIIGGAVFWPYVSYVDSVNKHVSVNTTLTNTDITTEGYTIIATMRTEYKSNIKTSLNVLGYVFPPILFVLIFVLGYYILYIRTVIWKEKHHRRHAERKLADLLHEPSPDGKEIIATEVVHIATRVNDKATTAARNEIDSIKNAANVSHNAAITFKTDVASMHNRVKDYCIDINNRIQSNTSSAAQLIPFSNIMNLEEKCLEKSTVRIKTREKEVRMELLNIDTARNENNTILAANSLGRIQYFLGDILGAYNGGVSAYKIAEEQASQLRMAGLL